MKERISLVSPFIFEREDREPAASQTLPVDDCAALPAERKTESAEAEPGDRAIVTRT